jgi:hypothetical protein
MQASRRIDARSDRLKLSTSHGADHNRVLTERRLPSSPAAYPQLCIDRRRHDFIHHDIVALQPRSMGAPKARGGRTCVRRNASVNLRQSARGFLENRFRQAPAAVIVDWQQNLNEVHGRVASVSRYPRVARARLIARRAAAGPFAASTRKCFPLSW